MRLFARRSAEQPMQDKLRDFVLGSDDLSSGSAFVDEKSALRVSSVYACVRIIAETIASLPLPLFRMLPNGGREQATSHPLYSLLHDMPNEDMSSFSFREMLMTSLLLWWNAYIQIVRSGNRIVSLYPLMPQRVSVERDFRTGKLSYSYSDNQSVRKFTDRDLMHIPALSFDGMVGISPIAQSREAIALSLATEQYGSRFFENGARPGGVLEYPGVLKDPARIRESWDVVYKGSRNAHRIAILEQGLTYKPISIPPGRRAIP